MSSMLKWKFSRALSVVEASVDDLYKSEIIQLRFSKDSIEGRVKLFRTLILGLCLEPINYVQPLASDW